MSALNFANIYALVLGL